MKSIKLAELRLSELAKRLGKEGVVLRVPPFTVHVNSPIPIVAVGLNTLYAEHDLLTGDLAETFVDFHVSVAYGRRFPRALCEFEMDGLRPFTPLAADEAFAFFEWGLNWCVTGFCHTFITVHSAVLERDGHVLIMPAPPGSGKSTLCAALLLNGWRLLSDEMALLDPLSGRITPSPRPVSLKNQSIEIVKKLAPQGVFGPTAHDTLKGTVAHMRAPSGSLARSHETALPAWVVFPKYVPNAPTSLTVRGKAATLIQVAENSFNLSIHGGKGFEALSKLIDRCDCYDFTYSQMDEALQVFARLPVPSA